MTTPRLTFIFVLLLVDIKSHYEIYLKPILQSEYKLAGLSGATVPWANQYHDDSIQDELHTLRLSHVVTVAVSCNTSTRPIAIW
jgi:hypothetical protein